MLGELHTLTAALRCAAAVCLIGLLAGCTPPETVRESPAPVRPEIKKERKAPLAEYEATLNPSDFDEEVGSVLREESEENQSVRRIDLPADSLVYEEEVRQGFRIQIFSSANIDEVTMTKAEAAARIPDDTLYVVYDAPVYKIRVGDYATRYDANTRLPAIIDLGYRDAWIVPDRVIVRKAVTTATPK